MNWQKMMEERILTSHVSDKAYRLHTELTRQARMNGEWPVVFESYRHAAKVLFMHTNKLVAAAEELNKNGMWIIEEAPTGTVSFTGPADLGVE